MDPVPQFHIPPPLSGGLQIVRDDIEKAVIVGVGSRPQFPLLDFGGSFHGLVHTGVLLRFLNRGLAGVKGKALLQHFVGIPGDLPGVAKLLRFGGARDAGNPFADQLVGMGIPCTEYNLQAVPVLNFTGDVGKTVLIVPALTFFFVC